VGTSTIGVAITVPEPWGSELQELRASYGDTLAWTIPTHVTLLPPTQVPVDRLPLVDDHLRASTEVQGAFEVVLHGSASFRPVTQTSYLVLERGAEECARLAETVRSGPLRRTLPYPYHPHVTMAVDLDGHVHDGVEADLASFHLSWTVTEFERYELSDYGVWQPVTSFPLAGV
jgi:2'-5' RNA ligase